MKENAIDGWLMYDFRGSNPVFWQALGEKHNTTRRNFFYIPVHGDPVILTQSLDKLEFKGFEYDKVIYITWVEMHEQLSALMGGASRIAMEYSPGGAIPMHSWVDAGTIDMVRGLGKEVVSSSDLFQLAATAWTEASIKLHDEACILVEGIKDAAFQRIGDRLKAGETVTEYSIKQFIREQFDRQGLYTNHGPIIAVNEHSGDPHYEPFEDSYAPIKEGDWVLMDIFAKHTDPLGVYCDITWTGYVGTEVPARHQEVFDIVTGARDAVIEALQQAWQEETTLQGWQVDRVAREYITKAGYGDYFTHRTGHSMGVSPTAHALGVNLDDLETHDTRAILPGVGFSVEPGIYLPEFGIRSEIDMRIDPEKGPVVTTSIQNDIIRIMP